MLLLLLCVRETRTIDANERSNIRVGKGGSVGCFSAFFFRVLVVTLRLKTILDLKIKRSGLPRPPKPSKQLLSTLDCPLFLPSVVFGHPPIASSPQSRALPMATHGIKQLHKLTVAYCPHSGSSRHLRAFLGSSDGFFRKFAQENPTLNIDVIQRRGKHPFVRGEYVKGWDKTICVKNETDEVICKQINNLNNSSGRKLKKFKSPVIAKNVSTQGVWTPALNIRDEDWIDQMEVVTIEDYGSEDSDEKHRKHRIVGRGQFNHVEV